MDIHSFHSFYCLSGILKCINNRKKIIVFKSYYTGQSNLMILVRKTIVLTIYWRSSICIHYKTLHNKLTFVLS